MQRRPRRRRRADAACALRAQSARERCCAARGRQNSKLIFSRLTTTSTPPHHPRRLLAGESGISNIDRFDASEFPTRFAGQIKNFDDEGCAVPRRAAPFWLLCARCGCGGACGGGGSVGERGSKAAAAVSHSSSSRRLATHEPKHKTTRYKTQHSPSPPHTQPHRQEERAPLRRLPQVHARRRQEGARAGRPRQGQGRGV